MMDAVDSTGRTIIPGDVVRYRHDGLLHEVTRLCGERVPTDRACRGKAYRPVYVEGWTWLCPLDCTIEVPAPRLEAVA